ncbi:MAG: radical SAM protein, partial [Methanosarcinaceae archaeon]|nr:radical SAM protein [Methanosarcinaceae archaeon]
VPAGSVLRDVMCEVLENGTTFGRQLGSYPLLVGIPANLPLRQFTDVTVTGHGMRSITGIPYPLQVNSAPSTLLRELPVGKGDADAIASGAPYSDEEDFIRRVKEGKSLLRYIEI